MPKPKEETTVSQPIRYHINVPQKRIFNRDNGEYEILPAYSTPVWVKYHETMRIVEGQADTEDISIALELLEMGAEVTPDPRPLAQERHAQDLKASAGGNMSRLQELARYVNETNEWRAEHGFDPLTVTAPDVPMAVSALLTTVQTG